MTLPGRPSGNWGWRFLPGQLTPQIQDRLKELTWLYGRKESK
jgi:4-alpha-glucanotransferase